MAMYIRRLQIMHIQEVLYTPSVSKYIMYTTITHAFPRVWVYFADVMSYVITNCTTVLKYYYLLSYFTLQLGRYFIVILRIINLLVFFSFSVTSGSKDRRWIDPSCVFYQNATVIGIYLYYQLYPYVVFIM